jgi:RyR domain
MIPIEEWIARVCHEVNRAYCAAIGDNSQPTWEAAEQWQRDSAIMGVKATIARPDGKPEDSHTNWLAHKKSEGWTYGPKKDPATKQHPCMVPYDQLPAEQRVKDHLFIAVVRTLNS